MEALSLVQTPGPQLVGEYKKNYLTSILCVINVIFSVCSINSMISMFYFPLLYFFIVIYRSYVSSKVINKLIQVHDRIFCCMAGSLADAQHVTRVAKFQLSFHR